MRPLRTSLATAFLAFACGLSFSQSPERFSSQVENGLAAAKTYVAIDKSDSGEWGRSTFAFDDVTYDVKKTDSALNPLVGVVHATVTMFTSRSYDTETDARASTDLKPAARWDVSLIYHPVKASKDWHFASGTAAMSLAAINWQPVGGTRPITQADFKDPGGPEILAKAISR